MVRTQISWIQCFPHISFSFPILKNYNLVISSDKISSVIKSINRCSKKFITFLNIKIAWSSQNYSKRMLISGGNLDDLGQPEPWGWSWGASRVGFTVQHLQYSEFERERGEMIQDSLARGDGPINWESHVVVNIFYRVTSHFLLSSSSQNTCCFTQLRSSQRDLKGKEIRASCLPN